MEVNSATICLYETTRLFSPRSMGSDLRCRMHLAPRTITHREWGHMKRQDVTVTRREAAVRVKQAGT